MKVISIIFILAAIIYLFYSIAGKKKNKETQTVFRNQEIPNIDTPIDFGYKCIWIAVKSNNKEKIAEILKLKNIYSANWKMGINSAYTREKIFITPKISEWTLIVGYALCDKNLKNELDIEQSYKEKIDKLSKEFGEAQFFATNRIIEYHIWAKSINGQTTRFYSYIGERGENVLVEGRATSIERQFNLINTLSEEAKDDKYFDKENLVIPDEDLVMRIAADWGINPTTLSEHKDIEHGLGLVGEPNIP